MTPTGLCAYASAVCIALTLAACQSAEPTPLPPAPEATPASAAASEKTELSNDAVDHSDIAVPEDFEEEAFKTIDEDNLEEQLDALEREIAGDKD